MGCGGSTDAGGGGPQPSVEEDRQSKSIDRYLREEERRLSKEVKVSLSLGMSDWQSQGSADGSPGGRCRCCCLVSRDSREECAVGGTAGTAGEMGQARQAKACWCSRRDCSPAESE